MVITDNEAIYDEQIAPLMTQIINICTDNHIPLVASFQITHTDDDDVDGPMICTTAIELENATQELINATNVLHPPSQTMAITITRTK